MKSARPRNERANVDAKFPCGWGNEVLYRMCRDEPRHTDEDVISGKIWLIGRAYAAAIERGAGAARRAGEDFHETIAPKIKSSALDNWLKGVADVKIVNQKNLYRVLAVHQQFNLLLKEFTQRERRSFASKYLHFHKPNAFFIYDTRAAKKIRQRVGRRRFILPDSCIEADKQYAAFVLRCIEYRDTEAAMKDNKPMTPRQLDQQLLGYGPSKFKDQPPVKNLAPTAK